MTRQLTWLRWAIALALGSGAVQLLADGGHGPIGVALASAELLGCALLVVPRTRRAGALVLAIVLAAACAVHGAVGEWPPASFAVYAAALLVVGAP
jgi:uncharacterized membrane protein YphA (DoxX/SURF4 family)